MPELKPTIPKREYDIWRVAITLAHNICVQESDRINGEDGSLAAVHATAECAGRIRGWIEPTEDQLLEMFTEAGVRQLEGHRLSSAERQRDSLAEALRLIAKGPYTPLTDASWCCMECGSWVPPHRPDDAHDHEENCQAWAQQQNQKSPQEIAEAALATLKQEVGR